MQLLNPFAPHMTEELWEKLGHSHDEQLAYYPWPAYEEAKCLEAAVEIAVHQGLHGGAVALALHQLVAQCPHAVKEAVAARNGRGRPGAGNTRQRLFKNLSKVLSKNFQKKVDEPDKMRYTVYC